MQISLKNKFRMVFRKINKPKFRISKNILKTLINWRDKLLKGLKKKDMEGWWLSMKGLLMIKTLSHMRLEIEIFTRKFQDLEEVLKQTNKNKWLREILGMEEIFSNTQWIWINNKLKTNKNNMIYHLFKAAKKHISH